MKNKINNTRLVKFKEDYSSKPAKKIAQDTAAEPEVIYRKGSMHAIHKDVVAQLEKKGAKMEVTKLDPDPMVKAAKKQLAENEEKKRKQMYGA